MLSGCVVKQDIDLFHERVVIDYLPWYRLNLHALPGERLILRLVADLHVGD